MSNQTYATSCQLIAENPFILNLQDTYGYGLIGSFFSTAVWGVSCLQLFIYYMHSELDSSFLKAILAFLWVLDTANEILILKSKWRVLILQYGRIAEHDRIPLEVWHHVWVEFTVTLVVQLYFIRRIYKFSVAMLRGTKSKMVLGVIALLTFLAIAQTALAIVYAVHGYGQLFAVLGIKSQLSIFLTIRGLSVVVDVCIAVAMLYLLRRKSHFSRTRRMISRLMVVIVSSGSFTAVLAVITLILAVMYPNAIHFVMFDYPLCSIYFSTLLANLNSRKFVRGSEDDDFVSQKIDGINIFLGQISDGQAKIAQLPPRKNVNAQNDHEISCPNQGGIAFIHSENESPL